MQLKCIAIDDEPLALQLIRQYADKTPAIRIIQTFEDAISGAEFLRNNEVDILFVDINMPDITGIDLVKSLTKKPLVIFTTAYRKFAVEGFELDAVDYLLKPISEDRFQKAVSKAVEFWQYKHAAKDVKGALFIRSEYRIVKIELQDIEYIEGLEDYIRIHLVNAKPIMTLMTLKAATDKLPADKFKRIHRSYIVATDKIKTVVSRKVIMQHSGKELPISDSYSSFVKEWSGR